MAVPAVFISSVVTDFDLVRRQAALAVESMAMHPVLAERQPANPAASRQAMFEAIGQSDYFLLLLGARYGEIGESGKSPTEEEYDEAVRRGREILVLVQKGIEMDTEQRALLERVRGDWGEGVFYGRFNGPEDVALSVAAALNAQATGIVDVIPAAQARAAELARGEERFGSTTSGVAIRVALVPVRPVTLLDAVALEQPELEAALAQAARSAELVPQSVGVTATTSAAGIRLVGTDAVDWTTPEAMVGADGEILVVSSVRGDGPFAGSLIDPARLRRALIAAGRFAVDALHRIDGSGRLNKLAISVAIPDAQYKALGSASGSSMSTGHALPNTVIAPPAALIVARRQITDDQVIDRLVAEIHRVFKDAGAIQS